MNEGLNKYGFRFHKKIRIQLFCLCIIIYIYLFNFKIIIIIIMHLNYNSIELQNNKRKRGFNSGFVEEQSGESQDELAFFRFMEECVNEKKNPYVNFVKYLTTTDYKRLSFAALNEQQVFFLMRVLNNWISEIFVNTQKNEDLPAYILTLTDFYRYAYKTFKNKYSNEKMSIASAFCFNNLATFFLRSKQYKISLQYFTEAAKIHDREPIANPVFSIVYANLSILSCLLDQPSKAQKYLQRGIKNSKAIHKQYLDEKETKSNGFIQNLNILIHMHINLIELYENKNEMKGKLLEAEKACMDLMINQNSKFTKKNWFIKYFYDKKKKNNRYESVFETLFKVNIEELRLFNTELMTQTPRKKDRLEPLKINNSSQLYQDNASGNRSTRVQGYQNKTYKKTVMDMMIRAQKKQKEVEQMVKMILPQQDDDQKNKNFSNLYSINNTSRMSNNTNNNNKSKLQKSGIKPKITFKKFKFEICFYEEGIIIKVPFSFTEERLDWDVLKNVIGDLELTELEENEIEVNCTEHLIANILASHIEITQTIRIKRKKYFDCSFRTEKFQYNFLYIGNKEFHVSVNKVNNQQPQAHQKKRFFVCFIENLERYFNVIKEDEYKLSMKKKILKEEMKEQHIYELDAIKIKNDINTPRFEEEVKPLILEMENLLEYRDNSFMRMVLHYEENEGLIGSLFDLRQDDPEMRLVVEAKNLKKYDCNVINTQEIQKNISFRFVEQEFGIRMIDLNGYESFWIKNFLTSLFELRTHFIGGEVIDYRNSERKNEIVFYLEKRTIENGAFIRKFLDKKYYRPITISVVGYKKKCFGLRLSFYNQVNLHEQNLFVICYQDWFRLQKDQKTKLLKHDASILTHHILCDFIKEIDLTQTFQKLLRLKKESKHCVLSLQKCLENTVYR